MSLTVSTRGALLVALAGALACDATGAVEGARLPAGATPPAGGPPVAAAGLYGRLGGENGIRTVVKDFVDRAAKDTRINGYFLNRKVNGVRLVECLVQQIGNVAGGPHTYPNANCRDMKTIHRGMKISMQDFSDTAAHLVAALTAYRVAPADISAIVGVVGGTAADIVEDPGNNMTVYQRVGRRPAIEQVVVALMRDVFNDPRINGFFANGNAPRLQTCLVRMVCGIDGPCKYGEETDGYDLGVSAASPCKDMLSSHKGITSPRAITKADFDVLVQTLVGVMDRAGMPAPEKNAVLGALGPTCKDIVAGGTGCN